MVELQTNTEREPFPWDLGIFDAHCHPTDTMSSIPSIPGTMKARTLTVMATRSQDQSLVSAVAESYGLKSREALFTSSPSPGSEQSRSAEKIVPAFGWHPWFSHQLYDDSVPAGKATFDHLSADHDAEKRRHYNAVLSPSPKAKDDESFVDRLPQPRPLSTLITETRRYLEAHPYALVGEIGLDKAFRIPIHGPPPDDRDAMTPGRRNGQTLSPYRVNVDHQIQILKAQLKLAGEMGRAASVHGVQGHGVLYETLKSTWKGHEKRVVTSSERKKIAKGVNEDFSSSDEDEGQENDHKETKEKSVKPKPFPPRICLHSFSGGVQTLKQYAHDRSIPAKIFFSFSICVNYSTGGHEHERKKHVADEVIKACPDDRILLESDLHTAGQDMDDMLEEIYRKVCDVKNWNLREGVEKIKANYEDFIFG